MDKQEILDLLKHLILQLRDHSKDIQKDPRLMQDFIAKAKHLENILQSLNSCDALYIEDEYGKFFKKEVQPYVSKIDPKLLKKLN